MAVVGGTPEHVECGANDPELAQPCSAPTFGDAAAEFSERLVPTVAVELERVLGQTGVAKPQQGRGAGGLEGDFDRARAGGKNRRSRLGPPPGVDKACRG